MIAKFLYFLKKHDICTGKIVQYIVCGNSIIFQNIANENIKQLA